MLDTLIAEVVPEIILELKKIKLKNGDVILINVLPESCKKFGGFLPGQRIGRKSRALPKPGESRDLWKAARVLYRATIVGAGNNPTATKDFWGQECLWIQIGGEGFVAFFPPNVVSAEDFANIGVVAL